MVECVGLYLGLFRIASLDFWVCNWPLHVDPRSSGQSKVLDEVDVTGRWGTRDWTFRGCDFDPFMTAAPSLPNLFARALTSVFESYKLPTIEEATQVILANLNTLEFGLRTHV